MSLTAIQTATMLRLVLGWAGGSALMILFRDDAGYSRKKTEPSGKFAVFGVTNKMGCFPALAASWKTGALIPRSRKRSEILCAEVTNNPTECKPSWRFRKSTIHWRTFASL